MIGEVVSINVTPVAGGRLESVQVAELQSGAGISGDRYARKQGTFSVKLESTNDWEVTLIELEEIQRYNQSQGTTWSAGDFRRNIVTRGVRLNDLVGQRFVVGDSLLEGVRLCEPCAHLGSLLGSTIVKGMAHRAGLRARIINGGNVRPGDSVEAIRAV